MVDKPEGMTSHDVVDAVRKRLRTRKVGHAGTLDPDATGILVLGVGRATRFLEYSQNAPKRYTAVARLGIATSTQDASGEVVSRSDVEVTEADVLAALSAFTGEIEQIPPMVSAVRIGGERLYEKARRGEEVARPGRPVVIYEAQLIAPLAADLLTLDVRCSAGTYIRTLVHDLGTKLGCGAHLVSLRRTEAGGFVLADAVALEAVAPGSLRPMGDVVRALPPVQIDSDQAAAVRHGRVVAMADAARPLDERVAVFHEGELVAVCRVAPRGLQPERVVAA